MFSNPRLTLLKIKTQTEYQIGDQLKVHQGLISINLGIDHPENNLNLWALWMVECLTFTKSSKNNTKSNKSITKNTISSILTIVAGSLAHSLMHWKKLKQNMTRT